MLVTRDSLFGVTLFLFFFLYGIGAILFLFELPERILLVSLELEHVVVVWPESVTMRHGHQGDTLLFHVCIEVTLHIDGNCAGALVQNSVQGFVVNQATHGDALLFTSGQDVIPVVLCVPAAFSADQVAEANFFEDVLQFVIGDILVLLSLMRVGVDQLIAQRSIWKVGSLWDIENLLSRRLVNGATGGGPQLPQDSEKTALSTAIRSRDHKVHSWFDGEVHVRNQAVSVW